MQSTDIKIFFLSKERVEFSSFALINSTRKLGQDKPCPKVFQPPFPLFENDP